MLDLMGGPPLARPIGALYNPENPHLWNDMVVHAYRMVVSYAKLETLLCCSLFFVCAISLAIAFPVVYILHR